MKNPPEENNVFCQKSRTTMTGERPPRSALPYLNNGGLIALTVGVNVLCALFFRRAGFGLRELIEDTVWCSVITAFLDVFAVAHLLGGKRLSGTEPIHAPLHRLIGLLPRNRFGLSAALALTAAAVMTGINGGLFRFYGLQSLSLTQFLVWKAIYSLILSSWLVELAVFRLIQPDDGAPDIAEAVRREEVRTPIPPVGWFAAFLRGMVFDFGFNVACGMLFGGTVIRGAEVVLMPIPCRGIGMLTATALTGIVIAFFVVPPTASGVMAALRAGNVPPLEKRDRFFAVVPRNRRLLTLFLLPFFALATVGLCGGIFMLFGFEQLNFFQFYLIRAIDLSLLCRALPPFLIRRYRQP